MLDLLPVQQAAYANVQELHNSLSEDQRISLGKKLPAVQTFVMGLDDSYYVFSSKRLHNVPDPTPAPVHQITFASAICSGLSLEEGFDYASGDEAKTTVGAAMFPNLRQLHYVAVFPEQHFTKELITNLRPRILCGLRVQVCQRRGSWGERCT
ncbi:hypothetical protein K474DRAFT_932313 [Panus rudis PR-1116 ss-1]|nr:hypothetical protein K474DRAFT_932313 [Panus rudis PR-1116 ss-1]